MFLFICLRKVARIYYFAALFLSSDYEIPEIFTLRLNRSGQEFFNVVNPSSKDFCDRKATLFKR